MSEHQYAASQGYSSGNDIECRAYHSMNITDKCAFLNATSDCAMDDGFINYLNLLFCIMPSSLEALSLIIMFLWWLILFIALATTADKFFCPSLAVISNTLRLSENLAGVTFLAFGNGSPDIFSSISAVGSIKGGDVGLAFGALLGAGVYVSTVVAGAIAVAKPFKAMERPLLKDIVFYIAAVFWTFVILYRQKIYLAEAIGFIGLYVVYVAITLLARAVYQRQSRKSDEDSPLLVDVNGNTVRTQLDGEIQEGTVVPRIVEPETGNSPTGSVRSRTSSRSSLSHVGIMAPNYMVRWAVDHGIADFYGDRRSRASSKEAPPQLQRQRTQSLTEITIVTESDNEPTSLNNTILSLSWDERRPRALSDMGPARDRSRVGDFRSGLDNPVFNAGEDDDEVGDLAPRPTGRRPPMQRTSYSVDYSASMTQSADLRNGLNSLRSLANVQADGIETAPSESDEDHRSPSMEFLYGIIPIDLENWKEFSILNKAYEIVKAPVLFLLLIVTPVVDCDLPKHGWNKYRIMLNVFLAPNFCFLVTKVSFMSVGGVLPAGVIILAISFLFPIVVFFTSRQERQPVYHALFAFLGFTTSILWIYVIANEIVNILETWGIYFDISNAILGLTFLAWGNSIGDTISNVVMAREGYPRMAISACFGGPLFNLLLGVGLPFTLQTARSGGVFPVNRTPIEFILVGAVTISLISSLIYLPLHRFKIGRVYGCYLFVLYVTFLTIAILTETKIIKFNV